MRRPPFGGVYKHNGFFTAGRCACRCLLRFPTIQPPRGRRPDVRIGRKIRVFVRTGSASGGGLRSACSDTLPLASHGVPGLSSVEPSRVSCEPAVTSRLHGFSLWCFLFFYFSPRFVAKPSALPPPGVSKRDALMIVSDWPCFLRPNESLASRPSCTVPRPQDFFFFFFFAVRPPARPRACVLCLRAESCSVYCTALSLAACAWGWTCECTRAWSACLFVSCVCSCAFCV